MRQLEAWQQITMVTATKARIAVDRIRSSAFGVSTMSWSIIVHGGAHPVPDDKVEASHRACLAAT
ncbi:MAG: hypothetical protein M3Y80_10875, partial [Verrucomicrobiota bacterium]|nr:hypothetical protein [Verrucomicrobiota bacterium]